MPALIVLDELELIYALPRGKVYGKVDLGGRSLDPLELASACAPPDIAYWGPKETVSQDKESL